MFKGLKEKVDIVNEHMGTFSKELEILVISTLHLFHFFQNFIWSHMVYTLLYPYFSLGKMSSIHLCYCMSSSSLLLQHKQNSQMLTPKYTITVIAIATNADGYKCFLHNFIKRNNFSQEVQQNEMWLSKKVSIADKNINKTNITVQFTKHLNFKKLFSVY